MKKIDKLLYDAHAGRWEGKIIYSHWWKGGFAVMNKDGGIDWMKGGEDDEQTADVEDGYAQRGTESAVQGG